MTQRKKAQPTDAPKAENVGNVEFVAPISPDWKDANAYRFAEKLTRIRWAWEFLRRNEAYERDYLEWDLARATSLTWGTDRKALALCKKWGISDVVAPEQNPPPGFGITCLGGLFYLGDDWVAPEWTNEDIGEMVRDRLDGGVLLHFNLDLPLSEQIAHARQVLGTLKTEHEKTRKTIKQAQSTQNFAVFLRILDAKRKGVSDDTIAQQFVSERLLQDSDNAKGLTRKWKVKALSMCAKGYQSLGY